MREVKPSDFSEFTADAAGVATTVTLQHADGRTAVYHILGEWDSDAEHNILPSASALAKDLKGAVAGDVVNIPADQGREDVTVVSVTALADEAQAWLAAGDAVPTES